jgi:hypothetical protein
MPYRVAANYAGREFACKQCQTKLSVPQPNTEPIRIEAEVEMTSGTQVMRRTTPSGRTVAVNPNQVFARSRETSGRLASVKPPQQKKSSAGLVIAIVAVLLIAGGVGAAFALGVFDSKPDGADSPVAVDNAAGTDKPPEALSPRERILKQIDAPGLSAAAALELYADGEKAGLGGVDMATIGKRVVDTLIIDDSGFSDAELMAFAEKQMALNARREAESVYSLIIERNRSKDEPSAESVLAREKLGQAKVDFDSALERIESVLATGVIPDLEPVRDEVITLARSSDHGWVPASTQQRFSEIAASIEAAEAEVEQIRSTDPFRFKVVEVERVFKTQAASKTGRWITIARAPYVLLVQLHADETEEAALIRMQKPISALEQFPEFFNEAFVKPMGLKRTVPTSVPDSERAGEPMVIKLFRDQSHWAVHLRDQGLGHIDTGKTPIVTELTTGHASLVYRVERDHLIQMVRAMIDMSFFNHHPTPPKTQEEQDTFKPYVSPFLNDILHMVMAISNLNTTGTVMTWSFFITDRATITNLGEWRKQFTKRDERVVSFGGPAATAKQVVHARSRDDLAAAIKANLESYDGWIESDLVFYTERRNLETYCHFYQRGLAQFLFNWGPDGKPRYREQFVEFLKLEYSGQVTADNYAAEFERVFGIKNGDWSALEADFASFQSGR